MLQLLYEEVLSHNALLDTITAKSVSISENFVTQLELQDLQERYNNIKDNAMVIKEECAVCQSANVYSLHLCSCLKRDTKMNCSFTNVTPFYDDDPLYLS